MDYYFIIILLWKKVIYKVIVIHKCNMKFIEKNTRTLTKSLVLGAIKVFKKNEYNQAFGQA